MDSAHTLPPGATLSAEAAAGELADCGERSTADAAVAADDEARAKDHLPLCRRDGESIRFIPCAPDEWG